MMSKKKIKEFYMGCINDIENDIENIMDIFINSNFIYDQITECLDIIKCDNNLYFRIFTNIVSEFMDKLMETNILTYISCLLTMNTTYIPIDRIFISDDVLHNSNIINEINFNEIFLSSIDIYMNEDIDKNEIAETKKLIENIFYEFIKYIIFTINSLN